MNYRRSTWGRAWARVGWIGCALALAGCGTPRGPELTRFEFERPFMGTLFRVVFYCEDALTARAAAEAVFERVAALEKVMSDYDPESELMRLCQSPPGAPVRVSAELFDVLERAQRLAATTDGAFDVTIGPLARLWRRARRTGELPSAAALARARESVGWPNVRLDARARTVTLLAPRMQLDLGGIGKGYAADTALAVLKQRGISRALVAAGGDIAVGDAPPGKPGWRVSIATASFESARASSASPAGPGASAPQLGALVLRNAGVSTSGDAEQFVEIGGRRYSHIVDPRTGVGLTERVQVTVVARSATDSDSVATAVSVLGLARGLAFVEKRRDLAAVILRSADAGVEVHESRRFRKIPRVEADSRSVSASACEAMAGPAGAGVQGGNW
ncbi:MAG: FAD:protein FMN transferase [Verrucomicrobiales bacterium]|nr:FAD:protein FMN transferase [Verrucomicrobiales bacterium]